MAKKTRHTYEYDVDLGSDTAPARVLRMVRPGSRVLEIGAGPGSITKYLIRALECDVVALEVEATAIEKLREFCPKVYDFDLNDPTWSATLLKTEKPFDFVIAADVLEHVYDPWKVLGGMKTLLSAEGAVILSLPHVSHAAVLGTLMDEDMAYGPWGLLDRTHVRFFGVKNVQALYASQGMAIEEAQFVVRTPEMTEFVKTWNGLSPDIQAALQRNRYSHVYQVVSRAVPEERAKNKIDLMQCTVTPADAETTEYWTNVMGGLAENPLRDRRSTIDHENGTETPIAARVNKSEMLDGLRSKATANSKDVKLIAYYLTQFHPIPENDKAWGKGFTEWTNVTKAKPNFNGHYQPRLPADLGFYDLRLRDVHHEQIALAKSYGIDGFCYYYYWFSGQRVLEKPLDAMLADPKADMPYCLLWANENWTRRWDGGNNEVILAQKNAPGDDLEFIKSLEPHFKDPRYIKWNGAPLLIVYRPELLPDPRKSAMVWRQYCRDAGIGEIHIASSLTRGNWDYAQFGFDSGVEFPPHNVRVPNLAPEMTFTAKFNGIVPDYHQIAEQYIQQEYGGDKNVFRTVFPSWDNAARNAAHGMTVLNGTPENYEYWLSEAIRRSKSDFPDTERLVFINAWNEWAEGAHLEPDQKYGHAFLEATLRAKAGEARSGWTHVGLSEQHTRPEPAAPTVVYKKRNRALSRGFRAVRDTLNGRRFKKGYRA